MRICRLVVFLTVLFWPYDSCFAGQIIAWGLNDCGQCDVPDGNNFIAIAAGIHHGLALRANGSIVAWGSNEQGQCEVPDGNYMAIAAGGYHGLALRADGSLVGWGANSVSQSNVPDGNDFVSVAAGTYHSLALKSDGSIIAWGANSAGEIDVPDGNDFVSIAAGWSYSLALRSSGSIIGWGSNDAGQLNIPDGDYIAIAAGGKHSMALKADRSIVSWGAIEATVIRPPSLNFKAIAAGSNHCLALQYIGSVVGWGHGEDGQVDIPAHIGNEPANFIAIAAGDRFSLGIHVSPQRSQNQWYVSVSSSSYGDGSLENPWDFATALASELVQPGHTVWVAGGTYVGPFFKPVKPSGTEENPIIYRTMPDQRVILTADNMERVVLRNDASFVWFWGFEVTINGAAELGLYGNAVKQDSGRGTKYINMVVHDCPNRSGFYVAGAGAEMHGCLSYRNGRWANGLSHGFYCQNRPSETNGSLEDLPWTKFFDCIAFENFGWGIHSYAESESLANMLYNGVAAYGNVVGDFISGGNKHDDNFVIRNCFTYFTNYQRTGAEFGYNSSSNGNIIVEGNVFVGGGCAVSLHNWEQLIFRNNTCYCPTGHLMSITTPNTAFNYNIDSNRYYLSKNYLANLDGFAYRTLDTWQNGTAWDLSSTNINDAPSDVWAFLRPNKYEPDRALLIIYNWPKTETVSIALSKLWNKGKDQHYRYQIVSVDDIWGEPIVEGQLNGGSVKLPMTGTFAPEFGCFLITRWIP
jgi:hypothetical protein